MTNRKKPLFLLIALGVLSPAALLAQHNDDSFSAIDATTIQECVESSAPAQTVTSGIFKKKRYSIKGEWTLTTDCEGTTLGFSEDFHTKGGPDLKVYLTQETLSDLTGRSVKNTGHKLSVLQSNKGAQSYIIPPDIDLSEYKSVIIHCEAFSVLWGGFDL